MALVHRKAEPHVPGGPSPPVDCESPWASGWQRKPGASLRMEVAGQTLFPLNEEPIPRPASNDIPYIKVAAAAAIPAALYYFSLFVTVDLQAAKLGVRGLAPEERPRLGKVVRDGWTALIPMVVLIYLMGYVGYSPGLASVWSLAAILAVALARRALSARKILEALGTGALAALEVVMACACVGLIIGMVVLTGIGLKLSTLLVDLAGGSFLALLLLTMLASLILGTALPTTATYVLLAVLVAPAITKMGVPAIAAHMFVFYFGIIAEVAIQTNNVEVDDRGFIYIVDRANTGLHILELTGAARQIGKLP